MARIADSIVGHQAEIESLFSMREHGRFPHSFIFAGPSGIGKRLVALAMAQALVCEKNQRACGVCGPCLRIEKQQSESLFILKPEEEDAKPAIKVEAVRGLLESLSLANLGAARVVLIDPAQLMNAMAANALLKTLEEPAENLYFILIANDAQQFLPTIRSRSQVKRFSALSFEELKLVKPGQPDWAYRSARGQADLLETLTSAEGISRRTEALELFEKFCFDPNFLLDGSWRGAVKDRNWAQFNLKCWLQMTRDVLILKTQARQFIMNTDQVERLKRLYELSNAKLLAFADLIVSAERDINGNLDPTLVFDSMKVRYARMD
jgi:DNA polymerase-3 subunit delta'